MSEFKSPLEQKPDYVVCICWGVMYSEIISKMDVLISILCRKSLWLVLDVLAASKKYTKYCKKLLSVNRLTWLWKLF